MHAAGSLRSKSQGAGLGANKLSQVHLDIPRIAGEPLYTGGVVNTIRNGEGKYDYLLGGNHLYKYEGNYVDGKKSKNGKFIVRNYCEYQGEFDNDEITGKGIKKWSDRRIYIGEFLNGEMNGKGKFISSDESEVYEGTFLDNKRHGNGIYTVKKNEDIDIYQGEFYFHKMHGTGVYVKESKFCASSNSFNNNCIQGHATITWNKRAQYEGKIANGALHGAGFLKASDNSYEYDGCFDDNLPTDTSVGSYLYSELDRSNIKVDDAPKDPKAKAPPPKKGAEVATEILVPAGGELGTLVIRAGRALTQDEIDALRAAATAPPAKGAKAPEVPSEIDLKPVPSANSLPEERKRAVNITLRRVLNDDVTAKPLQFTDEICPLWVRRKTIEEYITEPTRFPVRSHVFYNDKYSSVISAEHPPVFQSDVATISDSMHAVSTLKALSIGPESSCVISTTKHSLSPGAAEYMAYLLDFKLSIGPPGESGIKEVAIFQLTNSTNSNKVRLFMIPVGTEQFEQGVITCNWELRMDTVVICSWYGESQLDLNLYHSLCVCINKTTASVDLFIDGDSKMKTSIVYINEEVECCCLAETDVPISNNSAEEGGDTVTITPKTLSLTVGGENSNFTGFVKTLVIAAKDDRLDPVISTAYYTTYTRNEDDWKAAKENEKCMSQEDTSTNTDSSPMIPFEYVQVSSVQTTLVCGSDCIAIIIIPSTLQNGYYAICTSDGVNNELIAPSGKCRRTVDERSDILPSELEHAVRCVQPIAGTSIMIKVEKI